MNLPEGISQEQFSVRWTGSLVAPGTGRHVLRLVNAGIARLYLNGELLITNSAVHLTSADWPVSTASAYVELVGGHIYDIKVEFVKPATVDASILQLKFAAAPKPEEDDRIARAVALAKRSDVAIVCGGMPRGYETESTDRPDMALPGQQNELIRAVVRANPKTVVVLNCGAPVELPWIDEVPAVVLAYYPGQEGGHAIARILAGDVNPSGKLSVTYPKRYADTPAFENYPGTRQVHYGEGIFVGYRYYDHKDIGDIVAGQEAKPRSGPQLASQTEARRSALG